MPNRLFCGCCGLAECTDCETKTLDISTDFEVESGSVTSGTITEDTVLVATPKFCLGPRIPFYLQAKCGTNSTPPTTFKLRVEARYDSISDSCWFAEYSPSALSAKTNCVYGIRIGGVDEILNAVELDLAGNVYHGGRFYTGFAGEMGNIRHVTDASIFWADTQFFEQGDSAFFTANQGIELELNGFFSGESITTKANELVQYDGGGLGDPTNWTKYNYNLTSSVGIGDLIGWYVSMRAGDFFVAKSDLAVTFGDGTIDLTAGDGMRLDNASAKTAVASWTLVENVDPLSQLFVGVSGHFLNDGDLVNELAFPPSSNVVRGSSLFLEPLSGGYAYSEDVQWQAVSGDKLRLHFTGVSGFTVNSFEIKIANGFNPYRTTCPLARPSIHYRPRVDSTPGDSVLLSCTLSGPPSTLSHALSNNTSLGYTNGTYHTHDILGSSTSTAEDIESGQFSVNKSSYYHAAIEDLNNPGNYVHSYIRLQELVTVPVTQNRPRRVTVSSRSYVVTAIQANGGTTTTTDSIYTLAELIAGAINPWSNTTGTFSGQASKTLSASTLSQHTYEYPDFSMTTDTNDGAGRGNNMSVLLGRTASLTKAF